MEYPDVAANKWIQPQAEGYGMCCCDCGLVHRLDFRIVKGKVQIRARRDNRATGQMRRARGLARPASWQPLDELTRHKRARRCRATYGSLDDEEHEPYAQPSEAVGDFD
jgi:hypothetical protein